MQRWLWRANGSDDITRLQVQYWKILLFFVKRILSHVYLHVIFKHILCVLLSHLFHTWRSYEDKFVYPIFFPLSIAFIRYYTYIVLPRLKIKYLFLFIIMHALLIYRYKYINMMKRDCNHDISMIYLCVHICMIYWDLIY